MLAPFRHRNFTLLWLGGVISFTGDWMLFVALPVYAYTVTGSPLATGIMLAARLLPELLFGSIAGIFVDRWDRRRVLIGTNLTLASVLLPLLAVHSARFLPLVYGVAFVESTVAQLLTAEKALLPTLVPEDQLAASNSLNSLNQNLARLAGPASAGILMATVGLHGVTIVDCITYLVAAAAATMVRLPATLHPVEVEAVEVIARGVKAAWTEWLAGLSIIRDNRLIRAIFCAFALQALAEGVLGPLFAPFAITILHGGSQAFGWLLSAQAIGGVAGSLIIAAMASRIKPVALFVAGLLLLGVVDMVVWNVPLLPVDLLLMALIGAPVAGLQAGALTLMQLGVPDKFRGRVMGALWTSMSPMMLIGLVVSSTLGLQAGIVRMLTISGALNVLAGLVALVLMRRQAPQASEAPLPVDTSAIGAVSESAVH